MTSEKGSDILIVDDQPANLGLLSRMLTEQGFKVRAVNSGERAVEAARAAVPDCMLLDVSMPGMDGYAVCRAFQGDPALRAVPIVFLTAHDDPEHKVRAFAEGGRDYVSKPFQAEEVLARVRSHVHIRELETALHARNEELAEANMQLVEAAALKSRVTATLIHDIRSPLVVIGAIMSGELDDQTLADARSAYQRINALLNELLELSRSDEVEFRREDRDVVLNDLVGRITRLSGHVAQARGIQLTSQVDPGKLVVQGDAGELERVFTNLVDNALKFTSREGRVDVRLHRERGVGVEEGLEFATVSVTDTGPGIPPEDLPFVFDPYWQAPGSSRKGGVGLGLAIVARIVARHRGRVRVLSQLGVGTEFRVLLPLEA